ncbi:MAG: iron uptake porin [Cyanobacteria bacterium P01_D01_bin.123]
MSVSYGKALLAGSTLLGAALFVSGGQAQAQVAQPQTVAQVTSVSQLSDVQPTDWAFQALQSLVERYGCIAGYPDGTFRGNRAMTRYEFAAGMNACLDRINELIAAGLADKVSKEDLATVQRLQEEFQAELEALRGRTDALEAKTAELEAQQFSTTTKLNGELVTGIFGATDNNWIVPYRVRLNFDASIRGNDRLRVRLQGRDVQGFTGNGVDGVDPIGFTFGTDGAPTDGDITLDDMFYEFSAFNDKVDFLIGFNGVVGSDLFSFGTPFDALSDFSDTPDLTQDIGNPFGFGETGNSTDFAFGFNWQATDLISFAYGFTSFDAANPTVGGGVFNGAVANNIELAFTPTDTLIISLQYVNYNDGDSIQGTNTLAGGPAIGDPTSGDANGFGIGVTWEITPRVIFSGFYSNIDGDLDLAGGGTADIDADDYLIGFAFPDLFLEGANAGISFGQAQSFSGFDDTTVLDIYYSFPLTERITLTPGLYIVSDPTGPDSDTITVGGIRTTFSF